MNKAAMAVKTAASAERFPEKIDANITFFKGMYRDLTDTSVVLKLWNGKKWIWVPCGLTGRPFPMEAAILSPTLVHEEKWLMFHVPVKQENSDARTAKERMQEGTRVCSVRFTNTDSFAVCTVLDEGSRQLAVKNCRGGNAYRHHCRALLKKVEASMLPLLEGDLLHIMEACTNGTLADEDVKFSDGAAACVILASGGYPVAYEKGKPISGLVDGQLPDEENVTVYHSGTALTEDGQLVTNGGRVLGVTATGPRLTNALSHAYEAAEKIHFDKLHKRSDIGLRALKALAEKQ